VISTRRGREVGRFVAWYLTGWIALLAALVAVFALRGAPLSAIVSRLPRLVRWVSGDPVSYLVALVPYALFIVIRTVARAFRRGGPRGAAIALASRVLLPAAAVAALGLGYRAYRLEGPVAWRLDPGVVNATGHARGLGEIDGKLRGVNLVAGRHAGANLLEPLLRDNVEWIAVSPFGWQPSLGATRIEFHANAGPWSESDSGVASIAAMARSRGIKMMLKPQLWVTDGSGGTKLAEIGPATEGRWRDWFDSYRAFLLHHAALAERAGIDLLCIGAELKRATASHPEEWRAMIADVRRVYHGRLTYAANWHGEAEKISFWDALDLIGVQAYYPLTSQPSPALATLERGWAPAVSSLEALHARWGKPILFTEIGWKSTADGTARPWEWTEDASQYLTRVSTRTQANAYESFFRTIWRRPWFAGAFIWKWYAHHARAGGVDDMDFTPQNKPAEAVMARGFGPAGASVR
jgi:glycosyl hydrolase family 113